MKVCVTTEGDNLDAQVDPRFGRCRYFLVIDTDSMEWEAVPNASRSAVSGAGIQSGQLMANRGIEVLLTGRVGPHAQETLKAAGIRLIEGVSGKVRDVVDRYKADSPSQQ